MKVSYSFYRNLPIYIGILLLTFMIVGLFLKVDAQTSSPTQKRIANLKTYRANLGNYQKVNSPNPNAQKLNKLIDKTKESFDLSITKGESCLAEPDKTKRDTCKDEFKKQYELSKTSYRLTKYYSILSGKSQTCVEADFGMQPRLEGTSNDTHKEKRRLFICSGKDNSIEKPNFKWRVKSKNGKMLTRTIEQYSLNPAQFPNNSQLKVAEQMVGIE